MPLGQRSTVLEDGSESRRSVLLVINGTDFGGTERSLFQVAECLVQRGYGVEVLSLKSPGRLADAEGQRGIKIRSLNMDERVTFPGVLWGAWRMRGMLRTGGYNVIHSFLPRANIMSRVANRWLSRRLPHLSSERSTDLRRSRTVRLLNKYTCRWTDLVLAVTPKVRELLIERDGIPPEKIVVLENGIDLGAIDGLSRVAVREQLGLRPEARLFCSAGRLIRDKGHAYLIKAFVEVSRRDSMSHLLIVGDGPEREELEKTAREAGLADRVHFLGYRPDVIAILKDMDYFVLPSLEEGVPVVVLEAMACSLPIVATNVGGIPRLIKDGVTGLLVPPAEFWETKTGGGGGHPGERNEVVESRTGVDQLEKAMIRLGQDQVFAMRLGAAAREEVERNHGMDTVISGLEDCYRQAARIAFDGRGAEAR